MAVLSDTEKLDAFVRLVESRLYDIFPDENTPQGDVIRAAKYSLSAGGKRKVCHAAGHL